MKTYKCPECATIRQGKDNLVVFFCPVCFTPMKEAQFNDSNLGMYRKTINVNARSIIRKEAET